MGRQQRHAAARGRLLHHQRLARARTGGHRSLLRAGRRPRVRTEPPANAKVEEIVPPSGGDEGHTPGDTGEKPTVTTHGHGPATIAVVEQKAKAGAKGGTGGVLEGLPKVTIDGASASELRTELGTLLSFERGGVSYLLVGSVAPAAIEEVARGL